MEARGWKQLSQRAFGSSRKDPGLLLGRLSPDPHSFTPRSVQRRCDPFLMTGLSFAEVETCVLYTYPIPCLLGPRTDLAQFVAPFIQDRDVL